MSEPGCPDEPAHPFERTVIILCAPRTGSTLLFKILASSPEVWTIAAPGDDSEGESHTIIESIGSLHPDRHGWDSNRLTADDVSCADAVKLREGFWAKARDRYGNRVDLGRAPWPMVFLEKTPKNALRVPFLNAVFPAAKFIFLHRDPRSNIGSMIDGWNSGRFVPYPAIPGWTRQAWSFLLIPGWRSLLGEPVSRIAAAQWRLANQYILDDLEEVSRSRWIAVSYESLVAEPVRVVERICSFTQIEFGDHLRAVTSERLPSVRSLTAPHPDKWRKHQDEILPLLAELDPIRQRLNRLEHA